MSKRRILMRMLSVIISVAMLVSAVSVNAAVFTFETQYDYNKANAAWLTDLVIKEDMTTVEGMAARVPLVPDPQYPYTETAESFRNDVEHFMSIYSLEAGSQRAGYIYLFEILNANSELVNADISDADIRDYLEGIGIRYPADTGSDELIMARALFTAIATGAISTGSFTSGASLEEVLVEYMSTVTGMNVDELKKWTPSGSILSLDEYILAASKLSLWTNGYDVTPETDEDEVYRLVAAMTVESQGISVDNSLSFEEIKARYTAALLGAKYDVTVDAEKLSLAQSNDTEAYYILQLIGRKSGLSIREDNASYEEAFQLVAENTGAFDVADDDFYADIYAYDVHLTTRCHSLWIYPTAYATNSDSDVLVTVNGTAIRNNYYNEVQLDYSKDEQLLTVKVTVSGGADSGECTYYVTVHQGSYADVEGEGPVTENNSPSYGTSDSVVADVLSTLGMNSVISAVLDKSYVSLPQNVTSVVAFMAPTFDGDTLGDLGLSSDMSKDGFYLSVLDEVGAVVDAEIEGVPGIELSSGVSGDLNKLVTFE